MKLLDRYLLKQFTKHYLIVATALISIYLLVDFFEKIDNFISHGKPLSLAAKFFLLNIPFIIDQLGPILMLLAGVITLGILNHGNELNALKAAGIPLSKIIRPLFVGGLLVTGLFFCNAQWLLPMTVPAASVIWDQEVKGKLPLGIYRNGRYYYRGSKGFYSFERPDRATLDFRHFSYSEWNAGYNTKALLSAASAKWLQEKKIWHLEEVQVQERQEDGNYKVVNTPTLEIQLPETPLDFVVPEDATVENSLTSLYGAIHKSKTSWQTTKAVADLFSRVSYLLLGLPLLILGLPALLYIYRNWGRDLYIAIPASCIIAFLAWGVWGALQSLAANGYLPPLIAATAIHLLFLTTGTALLLREDS